MEQSTDNFRFNVVAGMFNRVSSALRTKKPKQKTHRQQAGGKGFNTMFAVSSIYAAKVYYESFKNLQS